MRLPEHLNTSCQQASHVTRYRHACLTTGAWRIIGIKDGTTAITPHAEDVIHSMEGRKHTDNTNSPPSAVQIYPSPLLRINPKDGKNKKNKK